MRREKIIINDKVFDVEIAETAKERARGLMYRRYLPDRCGMIFMMDGGPASFHMKNTHIPLDVVFFDMLGKVIKIDSMTPRTGYSRCNKDVRYVLELPMGTCQECKIIPGDRISFVSGIFVDKNKEIISDLIAEVLREIAYRDI